MKNQTQISAQRLGVMFVGALGAVATTVMAGVQAIVQGVVQEAYLKTEEDKILSQLPLCPLSNIVFGGWDLSALSVVEALTKHGVVPEKVIQALTPSLQNIKVAPGVLCGKDTTIQQLGENTTSLTNYYDNALSLVSQIKQFKKLHNLDSVVVVNLSSTETTPPLGEVHQSLEAFEKGLKENYPSISFGMTYAYAALYAQAAYVNFTPSVTAEIPALLELAEKNGVPIAGKDGKTGQTLYKTVVAPMFRERALRLTGWYSTNMLGNNDGLVLNDPDHGRTKIESKKGVLNSILGYNGFDHQIFIHYYKPRGDAKEAWDNIDFEGWLGEKMSMKINWLGKDSILAAPLVVDLARLIAYYASLGHGGIVPELACFFKSPYGCTTHHFFEQVELLQEKTADLLLQHMRRCHVAS